MIYIKSNNDVFPLNPYFLRLSHSDFAAFCFYLRAFFDCAITDFPMDQQPHIFEEYLNDIFVPYEV